jgi:hypothetical protein
MDGQLLPLARALSKCSETAKKMENRQKQAGAGKPGGDLHPDVENAKEI